MTKLAKAQKTPGKTAAFAPRVAKEIDRLALDAMATLGWTRKQAEFIARRHIRGIDPKEAAVKLAAIASLGEVHGHGKNTPKQRISRPAPGEMSLLNTRPKPRTAKERLERALAPDNGVRKRGGSPVVQGGSPGLGRRR